MTSQPPSYRGYRFPPEIISHAVWLYHRFGLSLRDVEDLLAERGVTVTCREYKILADIADAQAIFAARQRLAREWDAAHPREP